MPTLEIIYLLFDAEEIPVDFSVTNSFIVDRRQRSENNQLPAPPLQPQSVISFSFLASSSESLFISSLRRVSTILPVPFGCRIYSFPSLAFLTTLTTSLVFHFTVTSPALCHLSLPYCTVSTFPFVFYSVSSLILSNFL